MFEELDTVFYIQKIFYLFKKYKKIVSEITKKVELGVKPSESALTVEGKPCLVVGVERDLAAPPGLHVEPLGVPEMGLQPGHAPLPPVVLRQQVAGSSSKHSKR